jgi:ubiquinone/menaquinone biosynthesis C-methylase UbiE
LALAAHPQPHRVLDVGCGTGRLLQDLAGRVPDAQLLTGIDPAPGMIAVAHDTVETDRVNLTVGVVETLPYVDASFDLVVSSTSFDHWSDQLAGLRECARVAAPGAHLVLVDQFSRWLAPTMLAGHRDHARTRRRGAALLHIAGFGDVRWHRSYSPIIAAAVATR